MSVTQQLPVAMWETWTPDRAKAVLQEQATFGPTGNRVIKQSRVDRYVADMAAGRWMDNGEPVLFNGARLLNGQHRLRAIAVSGVTLHLLTVRGVAEASMPTIDIGLSRTPGDTVRASLFPLVGGYYNVIAAMAKLAYMYLHYQMVTTDAAKGPSRAQLVAFIEANPAMVESAKAMRNVEDSSWTRNRTVVAWHFLCGRKYPAERDVFFRDLVSGINLGADRPVRILRERFLAERGSQAKLPVHVWSAFIVKAWNAELLGRPMKLLRYRTDEPFPLLHGDEPLMSGE